MLNFQFVRLLTGERREYPKSDLWEGTPGKDPPGQDQYQDATRTRFCIRYAVAAMPLQVRQEDFLV